MKTKEEIEERIKELIDDESNFVSDNYGSESADNGFYEVHFSQWTTEETLRKFVNWIFEEKIVNEF